MAVSTLKSASIFNACMGVILAFNFAALSPWNAIARTWHVPGDAPTIQAGVNLAQPGDDVLVGPGLYPDAQHSLEEGSVGA